MGRLTAALVVLIALALPACSGPDNGGQAASTLTIVYTGSTNGALWPCLSCSAVPLGGVGRRAHVLRQLRHEHSDMLLVDSGDVLSAKGRKAGDRRLLQVYERLEYDAVNVGDQEFVNGRAFFDTCVAGAGVPWVSASLTDVHSGDLLVPPYVIRTVSGLDVALLGVVDGQSFMTLHPEAFEGVAVGSVAGVMERYLPELMERADVVIVLSNLGTEGDYDLATEVDGVDVIVGGHSGDVLHEPLQVDGTLIVRSGAGGEYVGQLQFQLNEHGDIQDFEHKLISLEMSVPEESAVAAMVNDLAPWQAGSQKEMMPSVQTGRLHTQSARCGACHSEALTAWKEHGHSRAFATLPPERRGNLGCLPCHATGWAKGGYIDERRTPDLQNVGCTACHQVRRKHLSWPHRSPVPPVTAEDCRACHTPKWTPEFDFHTHWSRIAH